MPQAEDPPTHKLVRWHVVLATLAAIYILVSAGSWIFGHYESNAFYKENASLYEMPRELADTSLAPAPQQSIERALGLTFQLPCFTPDTRKLSKLFVAVCPKGIGITVLNTLHEADQDIALRTAAAKQSFRKYVAPDVLRSRSSWFFAALQTPPAQLSLLHKPTQNAVEQLLLLTKLGVGTGQPQPLLLVHAGDWQGVQVGNQYSERIHIVLLDAHDNKAEFFISKAPDAPRSALSQPVLNAFVSSVHVADEPLSASRSQVPATGGTPQNAPE